MFNTLLMAIADSTINTFPNCHSAVIVWSFTCQSHFIIISELDENADLQSYTYKHQYKRQKQPLFFL